MAETRWKHAHNWQAWALGQRTRNGFEVRRVVWGRLLAREEKRPGETIRAAKIMLRDEPSKKARRVQ